MFERFTDRARRVLVLAQEEAGLLNHGFIGTEHILLGLVAEGDGLAAKALESLDISLDAVRERVREIIGPSRSSAPDSRPFTPRAKKALELSLREALQLGHNYIGTEHLLLGVVREGDGVGAQVLVSLGADLNRVRAAVLDSFSVFESKSDHVTASLGLPVAGAEDAWEAAWSAAGARPVGKEWLVEVVRPGRRPVDYANAYRRACGAPGGTRTSARRSGRWRDLPDVGGDQRGSRFEAQREAPNRGRNCDGPWRAGPSFELKAPRSGRRRLGWSTRTSTWLICPAAVVWGVSRGCSGGVDGRPHLSEGGSPT